MSAFIGSVRLSAGGHGLIPERFSLPSQPGLGQSRVWRSDGVTLVHRQRVLTLEDRFEEQPTRVRGCRGVVLFDGRLDDRAGLYEQLGVSRHEEVSDSALVAQAFEKWGAETSEHLTGVFALAIFDTANRWLTLSADVNGSRTLYFYRTQDNVVFFGTVLPALLSIPGVPRQISEPVLADMLANDFRDKRETIFKGVFRVLGATSVVLSSGAERIVQHEPYRGIRPLILRDDREYVEGAREVLDLAVASATRSMGAVPILGSGGLDSCCLAVSAASLNEGGLLSMVTIVPETAAPISLRRGQYASERPAVETLQRVLPGLAVQFVEPSKNPDEVFRTGSVFEETGVPLRATGLGWAAAGHKALQAMGATAVLDGSGGNFTLTWDGLGRLDTLLCDGNWFQLFHEARRLSGGRPRATGGFLWRSVLKRTNKNRAPGGWQKFSCLNAQAAAELNMEARRRASDGDFTHISPRRPQDQAANGILNRTFASEYFGYIRARYGIDHRRPLLDTRLVRFCRSIPEDQFLRDGKSRWLARRLLEQAGVPKEIAWRRDRGAGGPEWFTHASRRRADIPEQIARLRSSPMALRLIDVDRIEHIVNDWPRDAASAEARKNEFELVLNRALQMGSYIRWAESKDWSQGQPSDTMIEVDEAVPAN